jgi:hypothetical protein
MQFTLTLSCAAGEPANAATEGRSASLTVCHGWDQSRNVLGLIRPKAVGLLNGALDTCCRYVSASISVRTCDGWRARNRVRSLQPPVSFGSKSTAREGERLGRVEYRQILDQTAGCRVLSLTRHGPASWAKMGRARFLPSSTPHWSKEFIFHSTP